MTHVRSNSITRGTMFLSASQIETEGPPILNVKRVSNIITKQQSRMNSLTVNISIDS